MYSEGEPAKATVLIITFDQGIDTTTLDDTAFSLNYPAPTQVINTQQLIAGFPSSSTVSVPGTWSFSTNELGQTVATFTPEAAYQQNTLYTATLLGADASLTVGASRTQPVSPWPRVISGASLPGFWILRPGLSLLPQPKPLARGRGNSR